MPNWTDEIIGALQKSGAVLSKQTLHTACLNNQWISFIDPCMPEENHESFVICVHYDLYKRRKAMVLSRLISLLGLNLSTVYARDTTVVDLTKGEAETFVNANHLMGFGGGKTFVGLRDDTELVAVAVFSKILFMKYEDPAYYSVELERYCSLTDTTVAGGLGKLIKGYLQRHKVDDIVTYIDKEWSEGQTYLKFGFEIVAETEPLVFEVNRQSWQRRLVRSFKIEKDTDDKTLCYHVINKGNIKMRFKLEKK